MLLRLLLLWLWLRQLLLPATIAIAAAYAIATDIASASASDIDAAIDTAIAVYKRRKQRIPTAELNDYLQQLIERFPPPSIKGKYVKIKYVTQLPSKTPAIAFFCNLPRYVKEPYRNFLENKIREKFDFCGVPLSIYFRQK